MKHISQICKSLTISGNQCKSPPQIGIEFCYFHNPANLQKRKTASSIGGKRGKIRTTTLKLDTVHIRSSQDVVNLLVETVNQVRGSEINPRIANAIGYLTGIILKAREQGEIEKRLSELESSLSQTEREISLCH